ncbi:hypothetical protein Isop_2042 [Isosphaera pallida ATCC 43644]|jgi:hypothetical protein|uniref:Uncharacterized protein n=1 Tax=Isosphaera pallida (strain ATCC 43644 / DSM 9630 / IS1B) TaxID=575540 RepID=E8R3N7_ISOPI|nr:hypothetical protein [Isosphaera pallida]ADV62622.1 hypothetical protein Isop_2042 [Isosphaera pallida ATCC 43644]
MSTASKVLSVLVILMALVLMVLLSAVASLNSKYGRKLADAEKTRATEVANLEVAKAAVLPARLKAERATQEVVRATAMYQAKVEAASTLLVERQELVTRLNLELQAAQAALDAAQSNLDFRQAELARYQNETRDALAINEESQRLNAERREILEELQTRFVELLNANRSRLGLAASVARLVRSSR